MERHLLFGACLLMGQLFHLLIKANSLQKRALAANSTFHPVKDFIVKDIYNIAATLVAGIIVMFVLPEILGYAPSLEKWISCFFVVLGYSGSSVVLHFLSKADKNLKEVIDVKTNMLDEIVNEGEAPKPTNGDKIVQEFLGLYSIEDRVTEVNGTKLQIAFPIRKMQEFNANYWLEGDILHVNSKQQITLKVEPVSGGESITLHSTLPH